MPAAVKRRIRRETGSVQLWIDGTMTEVDRTKEGLRPPDFHGWMQWVMQLRLLRKLTDDWDARNAANILVDDQFNLIGRLIYWLD